ncbi:25696_t:CDS:1, partial [Gigaspora margarita]
DNFKKQVKELFKSNNRHYSPVMIWLTTKLAQVGQVSIRSTVECTRLIYPKGWLSRGRVTTWHKQVSELAISNLAKNTQQTNVFGISADESIRGQD